MRCNNCGSEEELSRRNLCNTCEEEFKNRIKESKPE